MGFPWAEVTELLSRQPAATPDRPRRWSVPPGAPGGRRGGPFAGIEQAIRTGRYQAAIRLLAREAERCREAVPELDQALFRLRLTVALLCGRRPGRRWQARALAHLREAARAEPASGRGSRLKAVVALYDGDAARALSLYPDRPPPDLPPARWALERALIALAAGRPEEVLPWLETAGDSAIGALEQRMAERLGACYWHKENWTSALTWWEKARRHSGG